MFQIGPKKQNKLIRLLDQQIKRSAVNQLELARQSHSRMRMNYYCQKQLDLVSNLQRSKYHTRQQQLQQATIDKKLEATRFQNECKRLLQNQNYKQNLQTQYYQNKINRSRLLYEKLEKSSLEYQEAKRHRMERHQVLKNWEAKSRNLATQVSMDYQFEKRKIALQNIIQYEKNKKYLDLNNL